MGNCHTATREKRGDCHTKCVSGSKGSNPPAPSKEIIQLRLTPERKRIWETWLKNSSFEINSEALFEAIVLANKFKAIQKKAQGSWLAELLGNDGGNE